MHAHLLILSTYTSGLDILSNKTVKLSDYSFLAVRAFLEVCYKGSYDYERTRTPKDRALLDLEVFRLGKYFDAPGVKDVAMAELMMNMSKQPYGRLGEEEMDEFWKNGFGEVVGEAARFWEKGGDLEGLFVEIAVEAMVKKRDRKPLEETGRKVGGFVMKVFAGYIDREENGVEGEESSNGEMRLVTCRKCDCLSLWEIRSEFRCPFFQFEVHSRFLNIHKLG